MSPCLSHIERWTLIRKKGNKRRFTYKTKASISLIPMGKMCLWHPNKKERRLFCGSRFIPFERCTSILKMVIKKVFLMKPKHQNHLPHREECVYDAQSWEEKRLLCESMFIPIKRWTSSLKMVIKEVFLVKP